MLTETNTYHWIKLNLSYMTDQVIQLGSTCKEDILSEYTSVKNTVEYSNF